MTSAPPPHPLAHDESLRRRLTGMARRWLMHGGQAEDLVQDAYLRTADDALPPTEAGRQAWLATVLHHLCIDFLRRQGRYREILGQMAGTARQVEGDWPQRLADQAQRVEAALAHLARTLAPGDAAAVVLYEVFEFTHAELGALTGRSEAASRQHLHRLLKRLRAAPARDPGSAEDDLDEDAAYLFALCRQALAQRDAGGLVAVLRACSPQAMTVAANAVSGMQEGDRPSDGSPRLRAPNLMALTAITGAGGIAAVPPRVGVPGARETHPPMRCAAPATDDAALAVC